MIKNDKQLQISKKLLNEFNTTLYDILNHYEELIDPIYKKIEEDAIKSQINVFENEIKEYELLKEGNVSYIWVAPFVNLHEILIKARIIKGWSHAELANRLDLKEQQIQRYEFSNYSTASIARINQVAAALDIDVKPIKVKVSQSDFFEKPKEINNEQINNAYNKIKQSRCLLTF